MRLEMPDSKVETLRLRLRRQVAWSRSIVSEYERSTLETAEEVFEAGRLQGDEGAVQEDSPVWGTVSECR